MSAAPLSHRFAYHPPTSDDIKARHERARESVRKCAEDLSVILDNRTRETALVFTQLEQALFWANADIARNQNDGEVTA